MDVGDIAGVSEVYAASNFKAEFYADNGAGIYLRNVGNTAHTIKV
jgi:hypothetical protein